MGSLEADGILEYTADSFSCSRRCGDVLSIFLRFGFAPGGIFTTLLRNRPFSYSFLAMGNTGENMSSGCLKASVVFEGNVPLMGTYELISRSKSSLVDSGSSTISALVFSLFDISLSSYSLVKYSSS